jgi:Tol biopolymer transport system component/dienelactone hydrolase
MISRKCRRGVPFLLISVCATLPTIVGAQTRAFTAEHMLDLRQISGGVSVAPNGSRIAYMIPDVGEEQNILERFPLGTVFVQSLEGSAASPPMALGSDGQYSGFPVFSPDGSRLALFFEGPRGGQLAVWHADTGEIRRVGTTFPGKATMAPQWASDSEVVYARPVLPVEVGERDRVQVLQSTDGILPGDEFFANESHAGLAVVDVVTGTQRPLLYDEASLRDFEVSPDGQHMIAALPSPATESVARGERNETFLWRIDAGGAPRKLTDSGERVSWLPDGRVAWRSRVGLLTLDVNEPGPAEGGRGVPFTAGSEARFPPVSWSPDRTHFVTLVVDLSLSDPEIEVPQPGMYSIARPFADLYLVSSEEGTARNLTADFDDNVSGPVWSADGSSLFFRAVDNGTYDETLYRYELEGGRLSPLASGEEAYGNLMPVPGGLLLAIQSGTRPSDLWHIDGTTGRRTRVTELNPQLAEFAFSQPELLHFDNAEGEQLGALLYRPPGVTDRVPVITYIYEKLTPGIHRFSARHQIFATHGYAVLMPNVKIKVGETGTSYVNSVVPAVQMVRDMGFTNDRFCLWGGSFGAYGTSFVITQTKVFDCAVSRATPPDLLRNWASGRDRDSDNIESGQARMGGSPFEFMERYLSQSAFFHLDEVETPVLLTHGVKDYTILVGEGELMFYALRRLGKAATLVLYEEGDHSLYRHSRADALDVHERMLDWFEKYLRPERVGGAR